MGEISDIYNQFFELFAQNHSAQDSVLPLAANKDQNLTLSVFTEQMRSEFGSQFADEIEDFSKQLFQMLDIDKDGCLGQDD